MNIYIYQKCMFTYISTVLFYIHRHWIHQKIYKIYEWCCPQKLEDSSNPVFVCTTSGRSKLGISPCILTYIFTSWSKATFLDTDKMLINKHNISFMPPTTNTHDNSIKSDGLELHLPRNKASNAAVCSHLTWSIQTGYTPQGNTDPQARPWF